MSKTKVKTFLNPSLEQHLNIPLEKPIEFKPISAKSSNQKEFIRSIHENDVTIVFGQAGVGKSLLSMGIGMELVLKGIYDKIIITRPTIEVSNEKIGYLPGSADDKLSPFTRPLYDVVDMLLAPSDAKKFKVEKIEVAPICFLRGRNFHNKYIVADEMSNATYEQLLVLVTRVGQNSKLIINGDPTQSDLPFNARGALEDMARKLQGVEGIGIVRLGLEDVFRSVIVSRILTALEEADRPRNFSEFATGNKNIVWN
jgi:phosphate starvation-inducible protein PhoH and related proteins